MHNRRCFVSGRVLPSIPVPSRAMALMASGRTRLGAFAASPREALREVGTALGQSEAEASAQAA